MIPSLQELRSAETSLSEQVRVMVGELKYKMVRMVRILENRLRIPNKEKLSSQSPISFVIASAGTRDDLLDTVVIPSILSQGIKEFEIIITGSYQGRYIGHRCVKYVPVKAFPVYFYKPFQKGVEAARSDWIVDLDDDMSLESDWYRHLLECMQIRADIYGFRLLNADGSVYGDLFDIFGKRQQKNVIKETTYFGSYIARREIFKVAPYPTFMSGDRCHSFFIARRGFKRVHLSDVCIIHHGTQSRDDAAQKANPTCFQRTKDLQKRLKLFAFTTDPRYPEKIKKWWAYAHKLEKKRKRIGIVGWFGHENVGDELILHNMLQSFANHEVSVYTDQPEIATTLHGIKRVFHHNYISSHLPELDLLLVGGGGVLHDRYIERVLPPPALVGCDNTPIMVYAAGIPFFDWCNQIRYLVEKCYLVSLRDRCCTDFFQDQFPEVPVLLLPDPGFLTPVSQQTKRPGKITLNIRMIPKGWRVGLPPDVNEILIEQFGLLYRHLIKRGYEPVVLGFEPSDIEWIEKGDYNATVVDFNTAIEEIASSEFLIGTRYHSGIIAATQHTPSLLINYQQKVASLKTLLPGATSVVDIKGLDLVSAFEIHFANRKTCDFGTIEKLREEIENFNDLYINHQI